MQSTLDLQVAFEVATFAVFSNADKLGEFADKLGQLIHQTKDQLHTPSRAGGTDVFCSPAERVKLSGSQTQLVLFSPSSSSDPPAGASSSRNKRRRVDSHGHEQRWKQLNSTQFRV